MEAWASFPWLTRALTGGSKTRTRVPAEALRTRGATKTPGARAVWSMRERT